MAQPASAFNDEEEDQKPLQRPKPNTIPGQANPDQPANTNPVPQRPTGPAQPQSNNPNGQVESPDPQNPEAPGQNEADAASVGQNTTNPLDDPKKDRLQVPGTPGEQLHEVSSVGTDDVLATRDNIGDLLGKVSPESQEAVREAGRHATDAGRQAQFGQHQGAAVSMAHAAQALGRAKDAEPDPGAREEIGKHLDATVAAGQNLQNSNRPDFNPSYDSKARKTTKMIAHYRKANVPGRNCRECKNMQSDGTCALVQGTVVPDYVCDLFQAAGKSWKGLPVIDF